MNARQKGADMTVEMIDRVVDQLAINGVETVNLGGNEPLFTNGANPEATLLPYIIERLTDAGIIVGLTTSGITILRLYRDHRAAFDRLNDVDVSFDSPDQEEHNRNRGANIYHQAVEALEICQRHDKPHTAIMCGMNWNFTIPQDRGARRPGQAVRRQHPDQPGEAGAARSTWSRPCRRRCTTPASPGCWSCAGRSTWVNRRSRR